MSETLTGGCLCGAIRYSVEGEPGWVGYCHCSICRRASGAPFMLWFAAAAASVTFSGAEPASFTSSDDGQRDFCRSCGTQLIFHMKSRPSFLGITAGSLDDPGRVRPREHLFWSDRVPGLEMPDGLPRRETGR